MAQGLTQPLTEMSARKSFWGWGKGLPALEADNLTAMYEPTMLKMWDPRLFTTL
jgi:hypothetical protein